MIHQCPLVSKKAYRWCEHISGGCVQIMNLFSLDESATQKYCDTLKTEILSKYRFLLYLDHLTGIKDVSIDNLVFLKKCGMNFSEIADLLHCSSATVSARLRKFAPALEEQNKLTEALTQKLMNVRIDNPIESLQSKWQQLAELRLYPNPEINMKAIKLQIEIEEKMRSEKDRLIDEERLTAFIRNIEARIIEADNWLRDEIGQANKYLEQSEADYRIPYQPIAIRIKDAIEADQRLIETRDALVGQVIEIDSEDDDD